MITHSQFGSLEMGLGVGSSQGSICNKGSYAMLLHSGQLVCKKNVCVVFMLLAAKQDVEIFTFSSTGEWSFCVISYVDSVTG